MKYKFKVGDRVRIHRRYNCSNYSIGTVLDNRYKEEFIVVEWHKLRHLSGAYSPENLELVEDIFEIIRRKYL